MTEYFRWVNYDTLWLLNIAMENGRFTDDLWIFMMIYHLKIVIFQWLRLWAIYPDPYIPSGKRSHNYGKSPCYQWENPLFLWPFSIAILTSPEGIWLWDVLFAPVKFWWKPQVNGPWDILGPTPSREALEGSMNALWWLARGPYDVRKPTVDG